MKEIEKNGGDPIADFAKYQKQKRKEGKDLALKQEMSEEQVRKDWQDFTAAHPDISLKTLMADEKFVDYADGKIGNKPLAQIYDGYKKFTAAETKQPEKKPEFVKETPGALGQTPPANPEIYSKDSYEKLVSNPKALRALSEEQFKKTYEITGILREAKIRRCKPCHTLIYNPQFSQRKSYANSTEV